MFDASVIVCTRNRASILPRLFDAFARMTLATGYSWEFIVVDNGSTDTTADAIAAERARNRLPLVAAKEPIPGKSRALNRALHQATGKLLVFTDDDVEPEPLWLQSYIEAANAHPQLDGFAGRVLPRWLGVVPDWLHTEGEFALPRGLTNTRDFGTTSGPLPVDVIPGGVNTALRKDSAERTGLFRVDLGPGTAVPYAEDTEYMGRFIDQGGAFLYVPSALLYHCNAPERMTKQYVVRWMYEVGRSQIIASGREVSGNAVFGIPGYLLRQCPVRALSWLLEWRAPERLRKKMRCFFSAGELVGYRQVQVLRRMQPTG